MRLQKLPPNAVVQGADWNNLVEEINRLSKVTTDGVIQMQNGPGGLSLFINKKRVQEMAVAESGSSGDPTQNVSSFVAKITGIHSVHTNQWKYDFVRMQKTSMFGYEPGSWLSTDQTGVAYNLAEYGNTPTGRQSNGVDVDNLHEGFEYQPIPIGTFVQINKFIDNQHQGIEYWIMGYVNGIDGVCE